MDARPPDYADRKVTVMGLGLFGGGLAAARYFVGQGARVTVTDLRNKDQLQETLVQLEGLPVRLALGRHEQKDFSDADLVVVNPAVPKSSPFLRLARERGIPFETETNLFFKLCPAPIIGVTGSEGKSTVTALIAEDAGRWNSTNTTLSGTGVKAPASPLPGSRVSESLLLTVFRRPPALCSVERRLGEFGRPVVPEFPLSARLSH